MVTMQFTKEPKLMYFYEGITPLIPNQSNLNIFLLVNEQIDINMLTQVFFLLFFTLFQICKQTSYSTKVTGCLSVREWGKQLHSNHNHPNCEEPSVKVTSAYIQYY